MTGFTVVELLVVVVIISILTLITWNTIVNARDRAKQSATMADMHNLALAVEAYFIDFNYPPNGTDFLSVASLLKPYAFNEALPLHDHWRHYYGYASQSLDYAITSFGKDGVLGQELTWETRLEFERDIILVNGEFRYFPEDFYGNGNNGWHYGQDHGTGRPDGVPSKP